MREASYFWEKTHQHKSGFTVVLLTRRIVLQAAMSNKCKYVVFYKALQNWTTLKNSSATRI